MSTYAAKPSSKGQDHVVVDLKPTKNFNRLETIKKF
ncbi:MAG: hypothetical protein K1060chlam1_00526 [Candidatus Anoxychlamydiales bacterium]|nr:hypothetical protein [Candidatus Anoxychlamydiales bacterium]